MDLYRVKQHAQKALAQTGGKAKQLTALYAGVSLGVPLLITVASFVLSRQLDSMTGLSALGSRAILETIQFLLQLAGTAALPFWHIGYLRAALQCSRGEDTSPATLLEGFGRFWAVLRYFLLQLLLVMALMFVSMQIAIVLFAFTPFTGDMIDKLEPVLTQVQQANLTDIPLGEILPYILPMYILIGVVALVLGIPVFYRLRLSGFAIMDGSTGALQALAVSAKRMRGRSIQLFRLDLQFWWFYLACGVSVAVSYGDVLLSHLGINLPGNPDAWFFVFYGIYLVTQFLLTWQYSAGIQTAYAAFYDVAATVQTQPQPQPGKQPWDDTIR